jgi:hypothetical protein
MNRLWQRSCPTPRHNMVSRGERELRGERRGKGGRSLLATAAPFFFIYLLAAPLHAQRTSLYARAGMAGSSPILTDQVATPAIAQLLGARIDQELEVVPAAGLALAAGARFAFWPRIGLVADLEYAMSELQAREDDGTRAIQDLALLQATVGFDWSIRPRIELGGAAGLLWYLTDDRGIFTEGADTSPLVEARAAWTPGLLGGRVALVGAVQTHRFGTPVIRAEGGEDGNVTRFSLTARVRLAEVGR